MPSAVPHVLVDYENTQQLDLRSLAGKRVNLAIFLGANQKDRIPYETVSSLLRIAPQIELVAASGSGRNALDFLIAFHTGRICEREPQAEIHILSKDKGFDPLIKHLCEKGHKAKRHDAFGSLPVPGLLHLPPAPAPEKKPTTTRRSSAPMKGSGDPPADSNLTSKPKSLQGHPTELRKNSLQGGSPTSPTESSIQRIRQASLWLQKVQARSRPRKRKTLTSSLKALFLGKVSDTELKNLLKDLEEQNIISIDPKDSVSYSLEPGGD